MRAMTKSSGTITPPVAAGRPEAWTYRSSEYVISVPTARAAGQPTERFEPGEWVAGGARLAERVAGVPARTLHLVSPNGVDPYMLCPSW